MTSPNNPPVDPAPKPQGRTPTNQDYQSPPFECDLVLKGGITSGIVYPPAILALATKYRFRSIGGASAGAIAAAAAAAAEYGRSSSGGFAELAKMQSTLEEEGFLSKLFQPWNETRPLYDFVLDVKKAMEGEAEPPKNEQRKRLAAGGASEPPEPSSLKTLVGWKLRIPFLVVKHVPHASLIGGGVGFAIGAWVAHLLMSPWRLLHLGVPAALQDGDLALYRFFQLLAALTVITGAIGGCLLAGGVMLKRCYDVLADRNEGFFGFCPGSRGVGASSTRQPSPALIDWMSETFNALAGLPRKGPPLTMGMLSKHCVEELGESVAMPIKFKLVTTNLSHARPYIFPLEKGILIFRVTDMEKLFPKEVVDHLKKAKLPLETARLPEGFCTLPTGDDMPVVVATRLSLSFPLLLTAVRLYTIPASTFQKIRELDTKRENKEEVGDYYQMKEDVDLEENWFSDGGIAVNFPLSMFDSWLPVRPTFGINLCDGPVPDRLPLAPPLAREPTRVEQAAGVEPTEKGSVFLPQPKDQAAILPRLVPIQGFLTFFLQILDTARSYRDNSQMGLASYRERVAQVYLEPHEGGLNLDMKSEVIRKIGDKGAEAAKLFLPGGSFDFEEHRWVRLRLLLSHLERELGRLNEMYGKGDDKVPVLEKYRQLLGEQQKQVGEDEWYRGADPAWCDHAKLRIDELEKLVKAWETCQVEWKKEKNADRDDPFFGKSVPTPDGILRVTPGI